VKVVTPPGLAELATVSIQHAKVRPSMTSERGQY
jgi:hypothetical protein